MNPGKNLRYAEADRYVHRADNQFILLEDRLLLLSGGSALIRVREWRR
jgi:hypothetical protein